MTTLIVNRINTLFSESNLNTIAFECGFCKRNGSKISPIEFLDIVLHSVSEPGYLSLNQSAIEYGKQQQNTISKQGIDKRYTHNASEFLCKLIEQALESQISKLITDDFLREFPALRIKDGTRFDLPPQLSEHFNGFGGKCTSKAALCIQYEFDLKTLKFIYLKFTSANIPDSKEASLVQDDVSESELCIRDLGYFNLKAYNKIINKKAYFISRLHPSVLVHENSIRICFKKLYNYMLQTKATILEKKVVLGEKEKLKTRLIIELVSEESYKNRIAALEKEANKKGRTITDESRYRARFSLIITNITSLQIPATKLYYLYRLRWQIELMFKHWKSKLGIHKVQKMKFERLKCLLYGKLLYIVLTMEIISVARNEQYKHNSKILSIDKTLKTFIEDKLILQLSRMVKSAQIKKKVANIFQTLTANHWQEKRKNRENFEGIFDLFYCKSE